MRINPSRHELEFGEGLTWATPELAERFYLWTKTAAFSRTDPETLAPTWHQVAGFDIAGRASIPFAHQQTDYTLTAAGVVASWSTVLAGFDGHDPELAMITSLDAAGRALSIDRYSMPNPESTGAATIAAQERAYLQSLLNARARVASSGGNARVSAADGTEVERMDLAALDRRVAEARARIAWFEKAAAGNSLPRAEHW